MEKIARFVKLNANDPFLTNFDIWEDFLAKCPSSLLKICKMSQVCWELFANGPILVEILLVAFLVNLKLQIPWKTGWSVI